MRPERGLVAGPAFEAPDGSFVVRRLARRVPSPGRGEVYTVGVALGLPPY